MKGIDTLRERVNALLKRHASVLRERDGLKKELALLKEENKDLLVRLSQAEEYLMAVQIGRAMPDEKTRVRSRKKLDEVIGEIDKILMTLND